MEPILLEMKQVCFAYEERNVLQNINVRIKHGEKIAVMGANGAGKSTFFLNLNGVLHPKEGEIFLEGTRINQKNCRKLCQKVGFVFQDAENQIIAPTVRAEVSFGPMNLGLNRDVVRKRVEDAIAYLELGELEQRPPHDLSGGEKKRVSIADILAMEPEIILFDEPMASLDPLNAEKVEQILEQLHGEGKTLLIATHDVDFAYRFADRILVFAEGTIRADGKPFSIFQNEEIREAAHLKEPAMLVIWNALLAEKIIENQHSYPTTPQQAITKIQEIRKGIVEK